MSTFRTLSYFFQVTATAFKKGTRFLKDDRPTEQTFRDLFHSILFRTELSHSAKEDPDDSTPFNPQNAGWVVLATTNQVRNRTKLDDYPLVVQPHQLEDVGIGATSNDTVISRNLSDKLIAGENVTITEVDENGIKLKIDVEASAQQGVRTSENDGVLSINLLDKLVSSSTVQVQEFEESTDVWKLRFNYVPSQPTEAKAYYVDSANSEDGNGSLLNPFKTLALARDYVLENPPSSRITINVLGGSYDAEGLNYYIDKVDWNFNEGAFVNDSETRTTGLFEQTSVNSLCNVYGFGTFNINNHPVFKSLDTASNTFSRDVGYFSFLSITTNTTAIVIGGTIYGGNSNENFRTWIIRPVKRAIINKYTASNQDPVIRCGDATTLSKHPSYEIANILINDNSFGITNADKASISIEGSSQNSILEDLEFAFNPIGQSSTRRRYLIDVRAVGASGTLGEVLGFNFRRIKFNRDATIDHISNRAMFRIYANSYYEAADVLNVENCLYMLNDSSPSSLFLFIGIGLTNHIFSNFNYSNQEEARDNVGNLTSLNSSKKAFNICNGHLMRGLPLSNLSLQSNEVWNDGGTLKITN